MRRVVYLAAARRDLLAIFTYIHSQSGSLTAARQFVDRLRSQCRKIASLPGLLGRPRCELLPDLRSMPFLGYVIFFRYQNDFVEIIDILEGHRDIDAYFSSEEKFPVNG